jgi:hypothetical protein
MWIEIKSDVFEDGQNVSELRKLIQDLCYKHKYEIFVDLTNVSEMSSFKDIYDDLKEIINAYYNRYVTENTDITYSVSTNNDGSNKCFTPELAIKFFNLPFLIILENSDNDGYFVDCLISNFKKSSKKIKKFKDENWLEYGNLGGCGNIRHFIERLKKNFNGDNIFLKCFVLLDSDLEYPQIPNPKRIDIENYLKENNVPFHFLEKREIENYLSDEVFESIDANDEFIKTYLKKLTSIQKDFIDIENGFGLNAQALEKSKPEVYSLFITENENVKERESKLNSLRNGIKAKFDDFKNDLPKLFENVTQEGLIERTKDQNNPNELKEILSKVSKLL